MTALKLLILSTCIPVSMLRETKQTKRNVGKNKVMSDWLFDIERAIGLGILALLAVITYLFCHYDS